MSVSNMRVVGYDTVHHLVSRIAHKVYFLDEDERNDFVGIVFRASEFTGVRLIGWCVMGNHFHILVYLPVPPAELDEAEIVRRYAVLKGAVEGSRFKDELARLKQACEDGNAKADVRLARLRRRMYDVASFMKIVKQWFTEEYNRRHGHAGTLWESAYHDRVIRCLKSEETRDALAYVHLNPIRAAITSDFDRYRWSSLNAFCVRHPVAAAGMRLTYGGVKDEELLAVHHERMARLLEGWKRRRAEEIARKRAAGYRVPSDPLTDEAMIAQATARLEETERRIVELRVARELCDRSAERRELLRKEVAEIMAVEPEIDGVRLAERTGIPRSSAYRLVAEMRKQV